jgi:tetratricopeptide (TPR) repeat protein
MPSATATPNTKRLEDSTQPPSEDTPTKPRHALVITRSKRTVNPILAQAYDDYTVGRLIAARYGYEQLLAHDANNLDALHGMAAISLREARHDAATRYFLRALEADPKDALAQAGLIALNAQLDPMRAETRLKILLAERQLPFLHFALGNLYARQSRWHEAEQAFFKAVRTEPNNPDALFNLAVSLDRLHQPKHALEYYRKAKAAATQRPAAFDAAVVELRLSQLQQ